MYKLGRGLSTLVISAATFFIILCTSPGISGANECESTEKLTTLAKYLNDTYPKLYEFLNKTHNYDKNPGNVSFISMAHNFIQLVCPCAGDDKDKDYKWTLKIDDADVKSYKAFTAEEKEKESDNRKKAVEIHKDDEKKFEDHGYNKKNIVVKLSGTRYYLRTYTCERKKNSGKIHRFYVITRPTPVTNWPIQWVDGQSGITVNPDIYGEEINGIEFRCYVKSYTKSKVKNYGPYSISWVLKKEDEDVRKVKFDKDVVTSLTSPQNETVKLGLKFTFYNDSKLLKKKEDEHVETGPYSQVKSIEKDGYAKKEMAGKYECVIVDKHGVSSSFRGFNHELTPDQQRKLMASEYHKPEKPFSGFVQVHVRPFFVQFIPIGVIGGVFIILAIIILVCPNNTDDIDTAKRGADGPASTAGPISTANLPDGESKAGLGADAMSVQLSTAGETAAGPRKSDQSTSSKKKASKVKDA